MNSQLSFLFLIIALPVICISCDTTDPPDNKSLTLKLEDVSCTEAWIQLTTNNLQLPTTVTLKQTDINGNTKSQILNLNTQDSLLYIDSLLPNQTYRFHTTIQSSSNTSNELSVTTMDTTSHNFTFESWTFGTIGSSTLYDVAIISPENIWCVGEILVADTSINGYTTYNAVHWDGSQWELKRINMESSCNPVTYPPLRAIWAFSENNIVVTSGGSIGWFDGITNIPDCTIRPLLTGSINKIWGSSSSDLYVVGNNGNIARYLNGTWSRINSGTNLNINDIWGTFDNEGNQYILCTAYNFATGGEKKLLRIRNFVVDEIPWTGNRELYTVWFNSKYKIYAGGEGLFNLTNGNWTEEQLPPYFIFSVRGDNHNNILAVGGFGFCTHFNGISWKTFDELAISGNYKSVAVKGGLVTIIGTTSGNKAIIVIGQQ